MGNQLGKLLGLTILIVVLLLYFDNRETLTMATHRLTTGLLTWLAVLAYGALVFALLAGLIILIMFWRKQRDRFNRPRDGSFPLRRYKLRGGGEVVVNPNNMIGPAGVFHPEYGWMEFDPGAGWDRQLTARLRIEGTHAMQALTPGDDAISSRSGALYRGGKGGVANAPTGRLLAGNYDKPLTPRVIGDGEETPAARPALLRLSQALAQSTPDGWILGQNHETGALARFNPDSAVHAGIVGVTGTGKTTATGYTLVAMALRHGFHPIFLDPKGGVDWKQWSRHGEWLDTDRTTFLGQLQAILAEHERRRQAAIAAGVNHVRKLPNPPVPLLVVLEEYGDLRRQLVAAGQKEDAEQVDVILDTLITLARMTDVHLLFIDQYPEHWSPQVIGGTKYKVVYRLGPNQGAKLEEYKAGQLPDHGRFMVAGQLYDAWHAEANLDKLLAAVPASRAPRVLTGSVSADKGEGGPPPVADTPDSPADRQSGHSGATEIQRRVWSYLEKNPEVGVRRMARDLGISKTYAGDLRQAYLNHIEQGLSQGNYLDLDTDAGRAQFNQWLEDGIVHFPEPGERK